ncbi:MAG: hypothetical protein ABEJ92_01525 [Halobacteriales archaeon]
MSRLRPARPGELQLKAVSVWWTSRGRRYRDEVLFVTLEDPGVVDGRVAEDLAELVADPTHIVVPDAVHESLAERFDRVEYGLGFCGPGLGEPGERGCRNAGATRRGFNRAQFGDRARVRLLDRSGGDAFRVVSVEDGPGADWRSEVRTVDFEALHADHGL